MCQDIDETNGVDNYRKLPKTYGKVVNYGIGFRVRLRVFIGFRFRV